MNIHDALLWLTLDSCSIGCLTSTHHPLTVRSGMASWVLERHPQAGFCGYLSTVMEPSVRKRRHMSVQDAGMDGNKEVCKTYENIEEHTQNSLHAEQIPLGPN